MTSGVKCCDECISKFNELKLRKDCRFIIYKIKDSKEIVVAETGDRKCNFQDFKEKLECDHSSCYAVLDFEPEANKSSLVLVSWIPDTAMIKEKMIYASSFDSLKSKLVGCKGYVQLNDKSDLTEEHFIEAIPGCCKKA